MPFKKICVVGLGYIGLPTAAVFASRGLQVVGLEINETVIETINRGEIHIAETGLGELVREAVNNGRLKAIAEAEEAEAFLIAVPTPFKHDRKPDLQHVRSAARAIGPVLKSGDLVILESTSPVGTTEQLCDWLRDQRPDLVFPGDEGVETISISYCPERVLPGNTIRELVSNDRIIGGLTTSCADRSVALYQTFVEGECIKTDARTAELTKLAENAYRDVNIAFANEISLICDHLDINAWELIQLANHHPRVNVLQPGTGVGGHCIAVDPWFIVSEAPDQSVLIKTARQVNDQKPDWVIKKVLEALAALSDSGGKSKAELVVACLGLAYKPNIGDLRESPALRIYQQLIERLEGEVFACEPNIEEAEAARQLGLVTLDQAVAKADILVILVGHDSFSNVSALAPAGMVLNFVGEASHRT